MLHISYSCRIKKLAENSYACIIIDIPRGGHTCTSKHDGYEQRRSNPLQHDCTRTSESGFLHLQEFL